VVLSTRFHGSSEFHFVLDHYWGYIYTWDSLEYGDTAVHRTTLRLDTYNQYELNRDYPACRDLIMAISPATVGDTHFVLSSTLYWTTQALDAARERPERPAQSITLYPTPFVDSFVYDGPRTRYRIFNVLGQEVTSGLIDRLLRVDLRLFPSGSYFFTLDGPTRVPVITLRKVE
jgi:hypothetical protein